MEVVGGSGNIGCGDIGGGDMGGGDIGGGSRWGDDIGGGGRRVAVLLLLQSFFTGIRLQLLWLPKQAQ